MAQATVSRRRPCRNCGGRYFVTTVSAFCAGVAILVAVTGLAKAILGTGLDGTWAVGGIVVAGIIALIGRGHRCIRCDSRQ